MSFLFCFKKMKDFAKFCRNQIKVHQTFSSIGGLLMPSIGHIVLAKEVMKSNETEEVILVEPFSVLTTDVFPFEPKFTVNIGVFSLKRGVTYQLAYFLYSPRGEKIIGNIADIQATEDATEEYGVDFNLSVNIGGVKFTEPGVRLHDPS
ncbi:hypothetical protein [Virgibacillus pantothenticus]|uniref:hypothetical protein n=3 Tax=Virgibacillus pantothenticus TaxID=1473 RepID=UPI001C2464FC|nr:hypothetical protein [Virgibacillus pantothenticus]MEB5456954.1 hypothetical protein [Virgibacillus pantothenticus]